MAAIQQAGRHYIKMKYKLILAMIFLLIIPISCATDYYTQNTDINLITSCVNNGTACSAGTSCSITTFYPNNTIMVDNQAMTSVNVAYFSYALIASQTSVIGEYKNLVTCNDSGNFGSNLFTFAINLNGKAPPGDNLIIFMVLAFIAVLVIMLFTLFNFVEKFAQLEVTPKEVGIMFAAYFGMFALYIFEKQYFPNTFVDSIWIYFISIFAITHVVIPCYAFAITWLKHILTQRELEDFNDNV